MKIFQYMLAMALLFSLGFVQSANAKPWGKEMPFHTLAGEVLIVEMGFGTARCGLSSSTDPVEFAATVREDYTLFKNDFRNLMNQVYNKLNITNKATFPVLIIEPDDYNSWRRVDMAEILMGENQAPWMYVMCTSLIVIYANNTAEASGIVYHTENGKSTITPVVGGWPQTTGQFVEFNYHEPDPNSRADSTFWVAVRTGYPSRRDVIKNIILSGSNWQGVTPAEVAAFKARLDKQRFYEDEYHTVNAYAPTQHTVWRAAKKLVAEGVLLDWDLAFLQSHFQEKGAEYIRQWVF